MILCLCNYKIKEDIDKICEECSCKEEFAQEIKKRYKCGDCRACYQTLISKYEEGKSDKSQ